MPSNTSRAAAGDARTSSPEKKKVGEKRIEPCNLNKGMPPTTKIRHVHGGKVVEQLRAVYQRPKVKSSSEIADSTCPQSMVIENEQRQWLKRVWREGSRTGRSGGGGTHEEGG